MPTFRYGAAESPDNLAVLGWMIDDSLYRKLLFEGALSFRMQKKPTFPEEAENNFLSG